MNAIDETNNVYGRWTVLGRAEENDERGGACWKCQCSCDGKIVVVPGHCLRRKAKPSRSCGCLRRDLRIAANKAKMRFDGLVKDMVEYNAFNSAKGRCRNLKNPNYKDYGGRGIEFRFNNFQDFLAEVGLRPSAEHSLDRSDNDGHYEKGNLSWQTKDKQANNRRSYHETLTRQIAARDKKIEELQKELDTYRGVLV